MDETLVYETVPNPKLKDEITIVSDNFTVLPEYIVFFSPSGVQSAIPFIKNVPIDWSFLKVKSFSITTCFKHIVLVYRDRTCDS